MSAADLTGLSLAAARDGLASGGFSSVELTQACLDAGDGDSELNAYLARTPELALEMAAASDARRRQGEAGVVEGIPIAVKDLFCTKDVATTAGSKMLDGFVPPYESTVTANLWQAGGVLLGKTNLDEFAMGSSNETSHFGPALNPWGKGDETLVPGGSSGGSASAVAGRSAVASIGTDTGGSIRQPASFCGIVGMKPTYGRCSRWGTVAFASSLDQAGPLTHTVQDSAIMLRAMASYDAKDSTSVDRSVPDYEAALTGDVRGLKVGVPKEYRLDGMAPEAEAMWAQGVDWLRDAGAEIVDVSLPLTKYALPCYYIIAPAEASSNLARYDGVRYGYRAEADELIESYEKSRAGFGDEVKRRVLIGTYVLSAGYYDAYYLKAQKVRKRIAEDFDQAFGHCDVLLTPTTPTGAFGVGERQDDPVTMYLNDVFTVTVNLAGLPGISVPAGLDDRGLPLGLQVIGRAFDEETMFRAAGVVEAAADFKAQPGDRT